MHITPFPALVAALSQDGVTAAVTVEGALDRLAFDVIGERILAPSLPPGQVVIWDNLNVHTSPDARQLIAARGCQRLWLPPSASDLTPIEQAFSKVKSALRRADARTRADLDAAITDALATVTATDAKGWFAHGGYPLPAQLI